jgi:hypothetical protein
MTEGLVSLSPCLEGLRSVGLDAYLIAIEFGKHAPYYYYFRYFYKNSSNVLYYNTLDWSQRVI